MEYVIVVHGIRDNGAWAERIAGTLNIPGHRIVIGYYFNYFSLLSFANPMSRAREVRRLEEAIRVHPVISDLGPSDTVSFIGHSFGTHLIFRYVLKYWQSIKIQRIVFLSSVLHSTLSARKLRGKVGNFDNFCSVNDVPLLLNNLLPFPSTGVSGRIGCGGYLADGSIRDHFFSVGHGGWFGGNKDANLDWFINGPLIAVFSGRLVQSTHERPKFFGWLVELFNFFKLTGIAVVAFGLVLGYHTLRFAAYENDAANVLAAASSNAGSNIDAIEALARYDYNILHDLVGGDAAAFENSRVAFLKFFMSRNDLAAVLRTTNAASLSENRYAALVSAEDVEEGSRLYSLRGDELSAVDVATTGDAKPVGTGLLECLDEELVQHGVFETAGIVAFEKPIPFECSDLGLPIVAEESIYAAVNAPDGDLFSPPPVVLQLGNGGQSRHTSPLAAPVLNALDITLSETSPDFASLDGLSFSPNRMPFWDKIDNVLSAHGVIGASAGDQWHFIEPVDLVSYAVVLTPKFSFQSNEAIIQGVPDHMLKEYRAGGGVIVSRCADDTCAIAFVDLPDGRTVAEVETIEYDSERCALVAVFGEDIASAELLAIRNPCPMLEARTLDSPRFVAGEDYLRIRFGFGAWDLVPRYKVTNKVGMLSSADCYYPGQFGDFFMSEVGGWFSCGNDSALLDRRGLVAVHFEGVGLDGENLSIAAGADGIIDFVLVRKLDFPVDTLEVTDARSAELSSRELDLCKLGFECGPEDAEYHARIYPLTGAGVPQALIAEPSRQRLSLVEYDWMKDELSLAWRFEAEVLGEDIDFREMDACGDLMAVELKGGRWLILDISRQRVLELQNENDLPEEYHDLQCEPRLIAALTHVPGDIMQLASGDMPASIGANLLANRYAIPNGGRGFHVYLDDETDIRTRVLEAIEHMRDVGTLMMSLSEPPSHP